MYFLNINKPKGLTSFDVIRELRKRLKTKQIGHAGTLDPLASGVLQVAVGSCAKLLDYLPSDKTYIADIKFGFITSTYDAEGEREFVKKPDFGMDNLSSVLNTFLGKTLQIPPKYSAIKQNGKKLCDIARLNPEKEIEIRPREIEIYSIELLGFNGIDEAKIKVKCKKGTYIRSLVYDIGNKLCCGAYMSDLIRIRAGNFKIEDSNNLNDPDFREINPLDSLNLPFFELDDFEYNRVLNGNFIELKRNINFNSNEVLLTKDNKLVSIAKISDNLVKPKKVFRKEM